MKPILLSSLLLCCEKSETITTNIAKFAIKIERPAAKVNKRQNGKDEFKLFVVVGNSDRARSLQLRN